MKREIVKVQTPIIPKWFAGMPVLIYNEDKSILEEFPAPKGLKKRMKGEPKQFFYAHINKRKMLVLDELAPWQEW